jgi:hypothetical protein
VCRHCLIKIWLGKLFKMTAIFESKLVWNDHLYITMTTYSLAFYLWATNYSWIIYLFKYIKKDTHVSTTCMSIHWPIVLSMLSFIFVIVCVVFLQWKQICANLFFLLIYLSFLCSTIWDERKLFASLILVELLTITLFS